MEIRVGNAPDFKMMRGQEILHHKVSMQLIRPDKSIKSPSVVDPSLATVMRDLQARVQATIDHITAFELEISTHQIVAHLLSQTKGTHLITTLNLPIGLTSLQRTNLAKLFEKFLKNVIQMKTP